MQISEQDMKALGYSLGSVRVPASYGDGYMAFSEYSHQIHCLVSRSRPHEGLRLTPDRTSSASASGSTQTTTATSPPSSPTRTRSCTRICVSRATARLR